MRRKLTRAVAATALGVGLALAGSAAPAAADHGEPDPGWNLIHVYPTKAECVAAGKAGMWRFDPINGQWDEFRCDPYIEPLSATGGETQWALWVVIYV